MTPSDTTWQRPAVEEPGLRRFVRTVRERALLVACVAAIVVGLAAIYVLSADKVYEARADVLVTPVRIEDETLASLGLVTESVDPTLDVQTATHLIRTNEVADRTSETLGTGRSADSILDDVTIEPVGDSNVIAVIAEQPTADGAAELANAFAEAAVEQRSAGLRERIDEILPGLQEQLAGERGAVGADALAQQVARLESLRASGDPTIRLENPARPPDSAARPRPALTLTLALVFGIALGVGLAYGIQVLDPHLRREEQLRALYRLPILARIPAERRARGNSPLRWDQLSPAAIERYRVLRATLTAPREDGQIPRSFLVTGAGPSEGKTTTAINLASALARSGPRVLVIEADLRRPAISSALGLKPTRGVVSVLIGEAPIEDAVVTAEGYGAGDLDLLLVEHVSPGIEELFSLPGAERLINEAEGRYDFVIVDSPPLTDVVDALPLARNLDSVLVVARIGKTRLSRLKELGELLGGSGIKPAGFAVVGVPQEESSYYYYGRELARTRPGVRRPKVSEPPARAVGRRGN